MAGIIFKSDFEGTGTMKKFVEDANMLFESMNNIKFIMPLEYAGQEPTITFKPGGLEFDMADMLIFVLSNAEFVFTGTATIASSSVEVVDGKLVISVEANNTP